MISLQRPRVLLSTLLGFAVLARVASLALYPLTDTTEARYAEIGRRIAATGRWLMPELADGVPFWGKPPLSFWMTAGSFQTFGVGEFAARLPAFLAVALAIALLVRFLAPFGTRFMLQVAVVSTTTAMVFVSAGTVETDPALFLGTTVSMVAFWRAVTGRGRLWGWIFFVGLAIALMAKGPVGLVITAIATGGWTLVSKQWREVWTRIPWISGTALTAALTLPWYLAAEHVSPGFLHYFMVGEHWQRFTVPGWQGDRYGSGHAYPIGTIWAFALLGTLPWSPWVLWRVWREPDLRAWLRHDAFARYLLAWLVAPLLLFTAARNILPAYVLPGLGAFGVLAAALLFRHRPCPPTGRVACLALLMPVALLAALIGLGPRIQAHSQETVVLAYRQDAERFLPTLIYYGSRPYSGAFYSRGRAEQVESVIGLEQRLSQRGIEYVVMKPDALRQLPGPLRGALVRVKAPSETGLILLRERADDTLYTVPLAPASTLGSSR